VRTVCQYHCLILQLRRKRTLLHWKNIRYLHTNTTDEEVFVFSPSYSCDFDLIAVIVMSFCVSMPHFTHIGSLASEIWRLIDFQYGGRWGAILLPVSIRWRYFLQKVNVYQHSNYRQDNSIHGRDITISILEKQTTVTLKLYFRFRFRLYHRNRHAILHQAAEFYPNRTNYCGNMTSNLFLRWWPRLLNTTSGFLRVYATVFGESKSIKKTKFRRHNPLIAEM